MKTTIAIVEDTLQIKEHIVKLLNQSEAFICVGAYETADEALRELVVQKPRIVILDVHLNEQLTGLDILKKMKPLLPKTDFLMFTIFEDDKTVFESIREGATGYLLKSVSDTKFIEALTEIAEGGAPMSPRIARQVLQLFQKKKTKKQRVFKKAKNTDENDDDDELTPAEERILKLLDTGASYTEISDAIRCSEAMVKHHIHKIYKKLHARNRTDALNSWREWLKSKFR